MFKKRDVLILGVVLCLAAGIFIFSGRIQPLSLFGAAATPPQSTAAPTNGNSATEETPPAAYLLVIARGMMYEPIPLTHEREFTLRQKDQNMENTIHATPDSIQMVHSTCENQDCVEQGLVTLENRATRLLSNMIVCLPNEVRLELLTPEEAEQVLAQLKEQAAQQ